MTTIERLDYPADALPDELRIGFRPGERVSVTVRGLGEGADEAPFRLTDLIGAGRGVYGGDDDAIQAYIDQLRGPRPD